MDEITGISLLVLLAALSLPLISIMLSKHPKLLKIVQYIILACYVAANLYLTIFSRQVKSRASGKFALFWSYRESFAYSGTWLDLITGNWGKLKVTNYKLLKQIILNILLYIPLGYLLPFTWPRLAGDYHGEKARFKYLPVLLIGFLCSAATELTQLIFHLGLFEFDDILNNTIGCFLGLILYKWFFRNQLQNRQSYE